MTTALNKARESNVRHLSSETDWARFNTTT